MKKLLSLLSVLTIGGTVVPTTIAASSYQKEEIINDKIVISHKNNSQKLMRLKRQVNQINFENWKRNFNIWKADVENSKIRLSRSGISSNITDVINWQNQRINELLAEVKKLNEIIKPLNTEIKVESNFMNNLKILANACSVVTSITAPVTGIISTVGSRLSDSIILPIAADLQWLLNSICNIVASG